jgi:hypothetical protein
MKSLRQLPVEDFGLFAEHLAGRAPQLRAEDARQVGANRLVFRAFVAILKISPSRYSFRSSVSRSAARYSATVNCNSRYSGHLLCAS